MAHITAFQRHAFQFKAFQIAGIGAPVGRFRHDLKDLERRLATQKSELRWFDEFIAASKSISRRIDNTKSETHRRVLIDAVDVVAEAINKEWGAPLAVISALQAAASATRITASIKHAEAVIAMLADWEDEEEIILLLQ